MLKTIGALFICLWIADFLTGFAHWLEDTYCLENLPLIGGFICEPNIEHHVDSQLIVRAGTFISRNILQWAMCGIVFGLLWLVGFGNFYTAMTLTVCFVWKRSTPLESQSQVRAIRDIYERPGHHSGAQATFDASQASVRQVLLRFDFPSKRRSRKTEFLAATRVDCTENNRDCTEARKSPRFHSASTASQSRINPNQE